MYGDFGNGPSKLGHDKAGWLRNADQVLLSAGTHALQTRAVASNVIVANLIDASF
jgi:hypothetical protein